MKVEKRFFTKDEIRIILKTWESKTIKELSEELGRSTTSISYIANRVRKAGFHLPKKRINDTVDSMVKEVLAEEGLINASKSF